MLREKYFTQKFVLLWLFLIALLNYFYALSGDFFGDDILRFAQSTEIRDLKATLTGALRDRPLLMLSIWLDNLAWKLHPAPMRLQNVFLHALVGLQLYNLLIELLVWGQKESNKFISFLIVAVFVAHPLHNQTINLVIQRGVLLSSLFGLLSLRLFFCYLRKEERRLLILSSIFFLLSLMSKSNLIFLPLFFLAVLFISKKGKLKHPGLAWTLFTLPLLWPVLLYSLLKVNDQASGITPTPVSYFLMQMEVIFTYFRLIVFPYGLKYLYDFFPPANLILNQNWFYLLGHVFVIFFAHIWIKDRFVFAWLVGFYLAFMPESSFFPIIHPAFEHRTYVPMMFLFILIGLLGSSYFIKHKKYFFTFILILILACLGLNQIRNRQIKSVDDWKLHTLEHSYSRHMYNINFTLDLLQSGHATELSGVINKYKNLYPTSTLYEVLIGIYTYYRDNKPPEHIKEVGRILNQYELPDVQRETINLFLIDELNKQPDSTQNLLLLENLLAPQLKIFFKNPQNFKRVTKSYQVLALHLLSKPELENSQAIDFLKMRTLLKVYFNRPDEFLKSDLEQARKKYPLSQKITTLNEMLQ